MRFKEIKQVSEVVDTDGKNTHLEHIEDLIFFKGAEGANEALRYINSVRDMLEHGGTANSNVTVKWDGAPAIFTGIDPADGKFFVAKKSIFNKNKAGEWTGKVYKSNADIDNDIPGEQLNYKMKLALAELSKLGIKGVLQGDMMYTDSDLESSNVDGEECWVFQPNTIAYAVPKDSKLGQRIGASKLGIIFHTTYQGDSIPNMQASFGADISGLTQSGSVWFDDAVYKDISGQASLTQSENANILKGLNAAASAIKTANFDAVTERNNDYYKLFMTYINARIRRSDTQIADPQDFANDFMQWYKGVIEKDAAKLKNQDPEAPAMKARIEKLNAQNKFVQDNMQGIASALAVYKDIVALKNMLLQKLNKVDSIKSLMRTEKGYEVVNPEGFVAIGGNSEAVKLVDRMEFSRNNFNAIKNWSK